VDYSCQEAAIARSGLLRFQICGERGVGVAEGDGYGLGVEFGPLGAGVGVVDGEEEGGLFGTGGFEAVGFDGGHVHVGYVLGGGELLEVGVVAHVALDVRLAVGAGLPDVADGEREQDGCGAFGARVGDVFADVPAIGVDGFGAAAGEGDVSGFVAEAVEGAAGFGAVERAAVVVAHLDEDVVAGLHLGEDAVPGAFVDEGAAGATGAGAVGDVDARGVEVVGEVVAPAEVGLVAGGGVADDEDGGERGVERSGWGGGGLRGGGRRRCGVLRKRGGGEGGDEQDEEFEVQAAHARRVAPPCFCGEIIFA